MSVEPIAKFIMDLIENLFDNLVAIDKAVIDLMFKIAVFGLTISISLKIIDRYSFISIGEAVVSLAFITLMKFGDKLRNIGGAEDE